MVGVNDGDAGFGVIEVIIALLLLAISAAVTTTTIITADTTSRTMNQRAVASDLANAALAQVRSIPYDAVGWYSDQSQSAACGTTGTLVTLPGTSPSSGAALQPTSTTGADGATYTTSICLWWVAASTGQVGAYKQVHIITSWTFDGVSEQQRLTSDLYPGMAPPYSTADNNLGTPASGDAPSGVAPEAPSAVTATTSSATSTDTDTIHVTWTAPPSSPTPASYYIVQYGTDPAFGTYGESPAVPGTIWTAGSLSSGTTYYFRVVAYAADGTPSPPSSTASATTATGTASSTCEVSSITASPAQGVVDSSGHLVNASAFTVLVNANSACATAGLEYSTDGGTTLVPLSQASSGTYTATDGTSSTVWPVGTQDFAVYINGTADAQVTASQVQICQEHGSSGKC